MNVVKFPTVPAAPLGWQTAEVQRLMSACAAHARHWRATGWEYGMTERGEPQLYLLGPLPEQDCILSVSRLGRLYVLEDGQGRVLYEHHNLLLLAEQASAALRKSGRALVARVAVAWCALREFVEEKVEPVLAEPVEVLTHIAPQLAALA